MSQCASTELEVELKTLESRNILKLRYVSWIYPETHMFNPYITKQQKINKNVYVNVYINTVIIYKKIKCFTGEWSNNSYNGILFTNKRK